MSTFVQFYDVENGKNLFSALCDVVPRIGETVCYSFQAYDREAWNEEAWNDEQEHSGKRWKVVNVYHEYRRYRVDSTTPITVVCLRRTIT
jgi:hypothetical protein